RRTQTGGPTYPILRCREAGEQVPRCGGDASPLPVLDWAKLYDRTRIRAKFLAGNHLNALTVDGHGQLFGPSFTNGVFHAVASGWLDQKDNTPATARLAAFACQRAVAAGIVDDAVDGFRRDGRQVSLAEGPFLAHEAASLLPIRFFHGYAHFLGHFRNALEAVLHRALAPDMRLEDFPVVDAMLARLAGVSDHHAALKLVEIDAQFNAMFAAGWEFDGSGAAKRWRIVVLRSSGNIDDDGFGVAADVNPVDLALPCSGKAVERGANGYGHGAGAADACAGGSFRIRGECEAALRVKELGDFREEREAVALGFYESRKGSKTFFPFDVARDKLDTAIVGIIGFDNAGG